METLVGYASEEGENSPLPKREKEEVKSNTQHAAPQGQLAAEWEAFECLLGGSAFAPGPSMPGLTKDLPPQPVAAPSCFGVQPPSCSGVQPPSCSGVQPPSCSGVQPPSCSGVQPPSCSGVQPPSCSGVQPPTASHLVFAPEETSDMSIDEESGSQSSSDESDSSSGDSKKGCEHLRRRINSKDSAKSRASRSSSSDSDSSCSPSRATTLDGINKTKQRLPQLNGSASDDSDSERRASSSDSSDSSGASPKKLCATYKSSDSDASSDEDGNRKDVAAATVGKSRTNDEPQSAAASTDPIDVTEAHNQSASPSHEVSLKDRLLKIADEHCSKGDISKADKARRNKDVSSSCSPSPNKRREVKRSYRRRSRSRSREKGRRRGGHRRSRSREHSRRDRKHRSRSGSRHRRSRSGSRKRRSGSRKRRSGSRKRRSGSRKRNRTVSTASVTKSSGKERKDSTTDEGGKETAKSEHKKSRSRSRSRNRRSRSRGHRSRSRGHRSRSRGRHSKSRHGRSRSRGRRSRSHGRDRRDKKRGRRVKRQSLSPLRDPAFEGFNRGGGWKKKERPLERGRNCMMRHPSPHVSKRHKVRLEKLLKQTAPPEKRLSYKESLLQQLVKMQKDANAGKLTFDASTMEALASAGGEKPSSLPLNSDHPLLAMMMAAGDKVTPQQAMLQTMAAMHQKAQELTGVSVPKYYNPAAVNPLKYAEQMQKRKLLWSKVKVDHKEEGAATWGGTAFQSDQDGKIAVKFRKLMGVKEKEGEDDTPVNEQQQMKQQELFDQLDRDYEFARMTTHTHRGIGLGFQSLGLPDVAPDDVPNPQ